jgi:hypothetical protein
MCVSNIRVYSSDLNIFYLYTLMHINLMVRVMWVVCLLKIYTGCKLAGYATIFFFWCESRGEMSVIS